MRDVSEEEKGNLSDESVMEISMEEGQNESAETMSFAGTKNSLFVKR